MGEACLVQYDPKIIGWNVVQDLPSKKVAVYITIEKGTEALLSWPLDDDILGMAVKESSSSQ